MFLSNQPPQFRGLRVIGAAVYAANIFLFAAVTGLPRGGVSFSSRARPQGVRDGARVSCFVPTLLLLSVPTLITSAEGYVVRAGGGGDGGRGCQWSFWGYGERVARGV